VILRLVPGPPILDSIPTSASPTTQPPITKGLEIRYAALFPRGKEGQEAEIRYEDAHENDGTVVYSGGSSLLMLTFNFLTVYASEISCQIARFTCVAQGKVRVEVINDQRLEQLEGNSASIDLLGRRLVLHGGLELQREF
jgi:hypothetical protein